MDQDKFQKRLTELEEKWFNKTITPEEAKEYADWYNAGQDSPISIPATIANSESEHEQKMLEAISRKTFAKPGSFRTLLIKRVSIAAAIVVAITGGFFLFSKKQHTPSETVTQSAPASNDIAPGKTGATLTLADGKVIVLDSLNSGKIANQASSVISLKNGRIEYENLSNTHLETIYNTLTTPHGRQFELELNDGTRVWLNSSSSIKFPVVFAANERRIEISGEVYFEVAKNPSAPFIVKVNNQEVQVLGTHFNVMAYPDEEYVATTLVEGSVIFNNQDQKIKLQPGQQSRSYQNGNLKKLEVETDEYTAWKRGFFQFKGYSIKSVMRQLERWYDIEAVEYKTSQDEEEFFAEIRKDSKLSDVLKALELTGKVHFSILNNKVIVEP